MATKYGLALAAPFVKGTAGSSFETLRRNHNKDNLIHVASSLGWLVRDTLGVDMFKACLNLVESSPSCGGGMDRLAKAYSLNRLGPYKEGAINAAKISSEDFVAHMAKYGMNSYGEPLDDEEEAAAAAAALEASSQQHLPTQQRQQHQQGESALFSQDLPVLSLFDPDTAGGGGGGDGGADGNEGKVSAPNANDDPVRVVDVDDPNDANVAGNVRAPAATDPLLAVGTGGRIAGQSQVQAGSQVRGQGQGLAPADSGKRKLCKTVWRDDVCRDWTCDRAHPPRCGDPMCFPTRRKDCQYWHRGGGRQEDQQQPQPSQLRRRPQQQQQQQGNGLGAGPGRAGHRKSQGNGSGPRGHRQQQQQLRQSHQSRPPRHLPRQQQKLESCQRQPQPQLPRLPPPPPPPPAAYPPPLLRHPGWQQRPGWQQPPPSYRDIAARGLPNGDGSTNPDHGHNLQRTGSGGFDLAQHNPAVISTVVAAVMAVLGGGSSNF